MALSTYPAIASPIKSVQRGSAAGAGTVTITAIDISKSMVNVFGTTSAGTVSASFGMSMNAGSLSLTGTPSRRNYSGNNFYKPNAATTLAGGGSGNAYNNNYLFWTLPATVNAGNAVVNAGSNNLVAAVVQGYLSGSTSLVVSGACRWEVVEFN